MLEYFTKYTLLYFKDDQYFEYFVRKSKPDIAISMAPSYKLFCNHNGLSLCGRKKGYKYCVANDFFPAMLIFFSHNAIPVAVLVKEMRQHFKV